MSIREHEIAARSEGKKIGDFSRIVSTIRSGKGQGSDDFLIKILGLNKAAFDEISEMIDEYPEWSDEDIAYELAVGDTDE